VATLVSADHGEKEDVKILFAFAPLLTLLLVVLHLFQVGGAEPVGGEDAHH
jgi:hypothetical protein